MFAEKERNNSKKEKKNIICLMCVGHMMHMKHMKLEKGFFEGTAGENAFQRMGYELLPPPAGRSPSLEEGGLGEGCVPARRLVYNSGCRVETLLVLMGVMGFLGDLREDRSRARPVGGSARRSIPSEREQPCCDL